MVLRSGDSALSDGLFLGSADRPVTSSADGTIRFWGSENGELSATYTIVGGGYTTSIDATPDGRRLAYASTYGTAGALLSKMAPLWKSLRACRASQLCWRLHTAMMDEILRRATNMDKFALPDLMRSSL